MPLRVHCQECDGQGTVSNANYLAYVDMASCEVESALFGSHADFLAHGVEVVVAEANLRYLVPCRFEDDLVVSAFVGHLGTVGRSRLRDPPGETTGHRREGQVCLRRPRDVAEDRSARTAANLTSARRGYRLCASGT
jgi:YbgC/YbaW family acyl-CoA thioester hydrolase